ncbi:unnamed protein product [Brassicogethes aeneus]|uniref:HECT domain-containing protein n=1 Tax=Brassicogethes aeneus TaxID=1431903 RepID=A0A9P0FMA2_BRAAE|nr:unnamed protein product [Brassicogethes aeneus]
MTSDEIAGRIIQTAMAVASTPTTEERSFPGILAATRASFRPRRRQQSIQLQSSRVLPQQLTINRTWSWNQLKDEILNLLLPHIKNMIEMVGFDLARCDRQKHLKRLEYSDDDDLEGVLSSGMIIVIPRKDFPNDLPIIEEHNGNNSRSTNMTDNDFAPNERQIVPRRSLNLSLSSQTHPDILDDDFEPNERQIVPRRSLNMSLSRQTHPDILDDDFEQTQRQIVSRRSLNLTLSRRTHLNILEENNSNTNEDALSSNEDVEEHIDNTYNVDEQLEPYLSFPFIPEEAEVKFIEISRQDILGKMFELYNDNSLTSSRLLIKFIDEEGIDGGGLLSEMFTIFWRALFESGDFFIGNDVLIPYIKLEKEMEIMPKLATIGRILGHMIMLTNKMPPRLALYTLHALSNKPDDYTDQEQLLL